MICCIVLNWIIRDGGQRGKSQFTFQVAVVCFPPGLRNSYGLSSIRISPATIVCKKDNY